MQSAPSTRVTICTKQLDSTPSVLKSSCRISRAETSHQWTSARPRKGHPWQCSLYGSRPVNTTNDGHGRVTGPSACVRVVVLNPRQKNNSSSRGRRPPAIPQSNHETWLKNKSLQWFQECSFCSRRDVVPRNAARGERLLFLTKYEGRARALAIMAPKSSGIQAWPTSEKG